MSEQTSAGDRAEALYRQIVAVTCDVGLVTIDQIRQATRVQLENRLSIIRDHFLADRKATIERCKQAADVWMVNNFAFDNQREALSEAIDDVLEDKHE